MTFSPANFASCGKGDELTMRKRIAVSAAWGLPAPIVVLRAADFRGRHSRQESAIDYHGGAPVTVVTRGKGSSVDLQFRIGSGFHVNSNTPTQEYLIPTSLKLNAPTDIVVGRITYPPGEEMAFAFAPDEKLSVYSGAFTIGVIVRPLASVLPASTNFAGS